MNQNYNTPLLVVDVGTDIDNQSDIIKDAFIKLYPTYKEAVQFALSGGVVYVHSEYTDTIPDTEQEFTMRGYYRGNVTMVYEVTTADGHTTQSIEIEVNGEAIDISYSDEGEGGGGFG